MPIESGEESISSMKLTRPEHIGASQLIWNDRCQAREGYVVDVSPPWGSETTVKAGRFDDESL
jgi:hypothetical protein